MAQEPPPLEQPFDGALRWLIPSFTTPGVTYLVDLGSYDGRCECACDDWRTRCGPIVKAGGYLWCKHVPEAYLRLGRWISPVLDSLDKNEPD